MEQSLEVEKALKRRHFEELCLGARIFEATQKRLRVLKLQESQEAFEDASVKLRENTEERRALEKARAEAGKELLESPLSIRSERLRKEAWSRAREAKKEKLKNRFFAEQRAKEKRAKEAHLRWKQNGFLEKI